MWCGMTVRALPCPTKPLHGKNPGDIHIRVKQQQSYMHIFVISLEQSTARREKIMARLAVLGLSAEVFPAIKGAALSAADLHYNGRLRRLFYGKDMSAGEIGCARSHIGVCQAIVARGIDRALVLEDDALLGDELPEALQALDRTAAVWDLVRFLGKTKDIRRSRDVLPLNDKGLMLARPYGTPGGAYAYVLNHRAAAAIAHAGAVTWMPIDTLHGQVWWHRLRVYCLSPSPVLPDHAVDSTIGVTRFSNSRQLHGWEKWVFPFTRAGFKTFDAVAKQVTFHLGLLRDKHLMRSMHDRQS